MAKHITVNEINPQGAALGQALVFDGTRFIPGIGGIGVDKVVANIAERDALNTADFKAGQGVQVGDASGDPTVGTGFAYYKWSGTAYIKIAEAEANDAVADAAYEYSTWNGEVRRAPSKNAVADKFKQIEDLLELLAPPRAPGLSGVTLTLNVPAYSARLSGGLYFNWYEPGQSAGELITTLFVSFLTLGTPTFRSGVKDTPSTYGTLTLTRTGNDLGSGVQTTTSAYDMTQGAGTNGIVTVSSINTVQNYWSAAQASAAANLPGGGGYATFQLTHTEAGASLVRRLVFDDHPTPLTITAHSAVAGTVVPKHLSGITYLGLGSTVLVTATFSHLFDRTYAPNEVVRLSCPAGALNISPTAVPNFLDTLQLTSRVVTLNQSNVSSVTPAMSIVGVRPDGVVSVSAPIAQGINTYGTVSTTNSEYFQDEARRLYVATGVAFDSTQPLPDTEAQVKSGTLLYTADYTKSSGFAKYRRVFAHTSAATTSGVLSVVGSYNLITFEQLNTGTSGIAITLKLLTENLAFDLARPFGQNAGNGSGDSFANGRGALTTRNGNAIGFSFGTFSSANNGGVFEVMVHFTALGSHAVNSIIVS